MIAPARWIVSVRKRSSPNAVQAQARPVPTYPLHRPQNPPSVPLMQDFIDKAIWQVVDPIQTSQNLADTGTRCEACWPDLKVAEDTQIIRDIVENGVVGSKGGSAEIAVVRVVKVFVNESMEIQACLSESNYGFNHVSSATRASNNACIKG